MTKHEFQQRVLSFIHENHLWRQGDRILAAVSGGPDSLGLLLFLQEIKEKEGIEIGCCCVDHHLRPGSGAEADYVAEVCGKFHISFFRCDVDVNGARDTGGGSVETVARALRYEALRDVERKEGYTFIAAAHHADDQAETVIFHFLRGAGLRGLSGMAPRRGDIIRPFLSVSKADIGEFISHFPYTPCHDETNDIPDAVRNKIRLELLPELLSYNPGLVTTLSQNASLLRDEDQFLEEETDRLLARCGKEEGPVFIFPRHSFVALPLALKRRVLAAVIRKKGKESVDFQGVERLRELVETGEPGKKTSFAGLMMEVGKDGLLFYVGNTRQANEVPVQGELRLLYKKFTRNPLTKVESTAIIHSDDVTRLDGWQLSGAISEKPPDHLDRNQFLLDADKVGSLTLRYPRKGERLSPRGMEGTKEISKILSEAGIPPSVRRFWPVVADENHVYWVGLLRGSRYGLAEAVTRHFLVLTLAYKE